MTASAAVPICAPYGTWSSPLEAATIAAGSLRLGHMQVDGAETWWSELRPGEGGRCVVVRRLADGTLIDMTPPGFSVRSRVHEYGGGDFLATNGVIWFCNATDQRVWRWDGHGAPEPLTPPERPFRYADFVLDTRRRRLLCVREEQHPVAPGQPPVEPTNSLVALALDDNNASGGTVLAAGADFYAAPSLSPDGQSLAWLEWRHPHMPWDETELKCATLGDNGQPDMPRCIAGGPGRGVSVVQPCWSPRGELYYVDDRSGWWNLWRYEGMSAVPVLPRPAEFSRPLWQLGQNTYGFAEDGALYAAAVAQGIWQVWHITPEEERVTRIVLPCTDITTLRVSGRRLVLVAGSPSEANAVLEVDRFSGVTRTLRRTNTLTLPAEAVAVAQPLAFPGWEGHTVHAFYYPPTHPGYLAPAGTAPPLIVKAHGGPTAAASSTLNLSTQYWTSRGFAVLDVDYTGSTGYGSAARHRLKGQWGIADVADCVSAARYAVAEGLADPAMLAISGGSAGGYVVLCALTFHDMFGAGASYYGIGDLAALTDDTHKFEAHYLDSLIGPWPQARALYAARSPLFHAEQITCPVIFFQGLDDPIVTPPQTERMVAALRAKGMRVEYWPFARESHGFRNAETIRQALEAECTFYRSVFGLAPGGTPSSPASAISKDCNPEIPQ